MMNSTVSLRQPNFRVPRSIPVSSAYWVLAAITLFNLNGLGSMAFNMERIFSPLILACCFVLIVTGLARPSLQHSLGTPGCLILSSLTFYIVIGGTVGLLKGADLRPEFYFCLSAYFKSIVVIAAVAIGSCALLLRMGTEQLLKAVLGMLIVSSATIAISPVLSYANLIPPETDAFRLSGAFQDPNEAGFFGCLTLVLSLSFLSFKLHRKKAYIALTLSTLIILGSFSRAAILISIIVFACFLVGSASARRSVVKWSVSVSLIGLIAWMTTDSGFMKFEEEQLRRINSIVSVFGQERHYDSSWSKRGVLLELALDEVANSPIFGNGLGRLHRLDKAPYTNEQGEPQGAHNQYLAFAGEAGVIPLALFLLFLASLLSGLITMPKSVATAAVSGWTLALALFLLTSHSALTLRFCNFFIGLSCAMVSIRSVEVARGVWMQR